MTYNWDGDIIIQDSAVEKKRYVIGSTKVITTDMDNCRKYISRLLLIFIIMLAALSLGGCMVKLVADYDSATFEEILRDGKKVDRFYGDLLETVENARPYRNYADNYVEIETDLRSLYLRNKARALNAESTRISEIILQLWVKYKEAHSAKDGYSNGMAKLDRAKFTRLFLAAADAEAAKKLASEDTAVGKKDK